MRCSRCLSSGHRSEKDQADIHAALTLDRIVSSVAANSSAAQLQQLQQTQDKLGGRGENVDARLAAIGESYTALAAQATALKEQADASRVLHDEALTRSTGLQSQVCLECSLQSEHDRG